MTRIQDTLRNAIEKYKPPGDGFLYGNVFREIDPGKWQKLWRRIMGFEENEPGKRTHLYKDGPVYLYSLNIFYKREMYFFPILRKKLVFLKKCDIICKEPQGNGFFYFFPMISQSRKLCEKERIRFWIGKRSQGIHPVEDFLRQLQKTAVFEC